MRRNPSKHLKAQGFTLLEIIIVVGLIAALAGALIAGLNRVRDSGVIQIEQQYVDTGITANLESYRLNMGRYPTTQEGLQALVEKPSGAGRKWRGPYLDKDPIDNWGNVYNYRFPGEHNVNRPDIWSSGPNGVNENGGGDDIVSWAE